MEPVTEDLSLPKQNMFFIEMESENFISTELWFKRLFWLVGRQEQTYVTSIFKLDISFKTFVKG